MRIKNIVIALCLSSCALGVNAATNGEITITANVVNATCDVSVSQKSLDLGNYSSSKFASVTPLTLLEESVHTFAIGVSDCDTDMKKGDVAKVTVSGSTLVSKPALFNSTDDDKAIMLRKKGTTTYIKKGDELVISTSTTETPSADFEGASLVLEAGLAATTKSPAVGAVSAPILFSFSYN